MLPNLSQLTVVKFSLLGVLKRVILLMVLVLSWSSPTMATEAPDDLQSLVMQAADRLDLPLFPFDDSVPTTQAKAKESRDLEENTYIAPLRAQQQPLLAPPLGRTIKPTPTKP